jgi:hypothetical protein
VRLDSSTTAIKSIGLTLRLRTVLGLPHAIFVQTLAIVLLRIVQRKSKVRYTLKSGGGLMTT